MIWWAIGGFWAGFICGMFAMCIFAAGIDPTQNRVDGGKPKGAKVDPSVISVTCQHTICRVCCHSACHSFAR